MPLWFLILSQFSILAFALLGGVFLAFSDFIMRSLATTGGSGGLEAMQAINREVFRIVFMVLFIGMAPVSLLLIGYGLFNWTIPGAALQTVAGGLYLFGCFGVTIFLNVPLNEELARMDASSSDAHDFWNGIYLPRWTFWNTVRTIACIGAACALLLGIPTSMSGLAA